MLSQHKYSHAQPDVAHADLAGSAAAGTMQPQAEQPPEPCHGMPNELPPPAQQHCRQAVFASCQKMIVLLLWQVGMLLAAQPEDAKS